MRSRIPFWRGAASYIFALALLIMTEDQTRPCPAFSLSHVSTSPEVIIYEFSFVRISTNSCTWRKQSSSRKKQHLPYLTLLTSSSSSS